MEGYARYAYIPFGYQDLLFPVLAAPRTRGRSKHHVVLSSKAERYENGLYATRVLRRGDSYRGFVEDFGPFGFGSEGRHSWKAVWRRDWG